MKKLILLSALILAAAAGANAQQAVLTTLAQRREAADIVHARILNEEARSWALRIVETGDVTYDGLYAMSARWIMGPAARENLFARIKTLLQSGDTRWLTRKELYKLEEGKAEIRAILSTGNAANAYLSSLVVRRREREAKVDAAHLEILELDAKYWAWRVAVLQDTTYNELERNSKRWPWDDELKTKLFEKIKARLSAGMTEELTPEEKARRDAKKQEIREIHKSYSLAGM